MIQPGGSPLYVFSLTAREVLRVADISRVSRDDAGELIGYQRPEVRQHIQEIVEYLDGEDVLFPNPIIIALPSTMKFTSSRGPNVSDGIAVSGTLEIPLPNGESTRPGWIVDGQQRALALARTTRQDLPVLVNAFIADSVDVQRDQFLRINNTKPLPRGLVAELLPKISSPLPPRLALRQTPSALCDLLNRNPDSPFRGLIRRPSANAEERKTAVVTDTGIIQMLQESLTTPSGCLYPYRNLSSGETDFVGIWTALLMYWNAVKETFPEAWGKQPAKSRLMHGAGIRAMGRLMDRIMAAMDPRQPEADEQIRSDLKLIAPYCHWTSGTWEGMGMRWNEIQNVPRHTHELSSYLIRSYLQTRITQR
ncbi:MAG: tgtA5 cluster protein 1 [Gemmatimonadales bacterium]|nr:tgtA5 cluster protein 1 [Gemmatimonadales bacterium]